MNGRDSAKSCPDLERRGMTKYGEIIKTVCIAEGTSLTKLAKEIGISRQAMYKRLSGDMSARKFEEMLGALGYSVYYGKEGRVKKV